MTMRTARPHILPLLLCCLAAPAATATEHAFPLDALQTAACRVVGGRVVLGEWFDMGTGPGLAMEAEQAVDLIADPSAGVAEAECSGGRCVLKVDRALFPVNVTRPGRYRRWVRGFFPQGGGWVHSESLDYRQPQWHTDCDGSTAGRWVWVAGPVYELSARVHLLWLHNWHGGARLDKVALLPENAPAPEGVGPTATPRSPARAGWVMTPQLAVPGLTGKPEARWPAETGSGKVEFRISVDGGQSWHAFGGATVSGSSSSLMLKASLSAGAGGVGPALGAPSVSYQTDPSAFVALENGEVRASFLRATGGLVDLLNKRTGVHCLSGGSAAPPFELRHLPTGAAQPETVQPKDMRLVSLDSAPASLTARYQIAGKATAELRVALKGGELTWTLTLDNASALDLVEVACPCVRGVRLGDQSADDLLMTPNWQGGVETSDPVNANGGSVPYPCGGGAAWLDLYERTPGHGLYLSSHDPSLMGCVLAARPQVDTGTLTFSLTKFAHVRPGQRWASPPAVTGVHTGDWHVAADAYRTWAQGWMHRRTPPEWVREADGWYGLVVSADGNRVPFRDIPQALKRARELGTNYLQVWGQMTGGSNCDSLPYPNPVLGSLDEFKAAIAEVQRWGGHITFYVSSQFWKVNARDGDSVGTTPRSMLPATVPIWDWDEWRDYAIRNYAGVCSGDTKLSEDDQKRYGTPWLRTVPCPYTDAWANRHLLGWCVERYGAEYGASGIYLDETCAAGERLCFAANHGHEHHGIWGASLTRDMQRMVTEGRKRDPNWMFAMEGCGDAVGQWADVNLISPASAKKPGQWGANRRFAPEAFHYTFPDYIIYDGVANGTYGVSADEVFLKTHLHGNRYDSFSTGAAPLVALRQKFKQFLYRARFTDNVGLTVSDPAVQAKINVLKDDRNDVRVVNLLNVNGKTDVNVTVRDAPAGEVRGYMFDVEGKEGPLEVRTGTEGVVVTAPTGKASTVLIVGRCEPLVRPVVTSLVAGERGDLAVTVTNPGARPVTGKLRIEAALAGVTAATTNVTVAPGGSIAATIPLETTPNAERRCRTGHVLFETRDGAVRRPVEVLVTSPFEVSAQLRGQRVQVTLRNVGHTPREGTIILSGEPLPETKRPFSVAAAGETTLTIEAPALAAIAAPIACQAAIVLGNVTDTQGFTLRPLVLNGDFENPGAAGRPGAWSFQNAEMASTDGGAAEGQVCLKLQGKPGAFVEADQFIPVREGDTGVAHVKMKRTPGRAGRAAPAVVLFRKQGPERYVYMQKTSKLPDDQWNDYAGAFTVTDDVSRV
ncbi:MAG: hypothetical protein KKI08_28225, partial [Armatimonadetes bacterium]|nr:hypothetical protein [Armatimonadota bacterium]